MRRPLVLAAVAVVAFVGAGCGMTTNTSSPTCTSVHAEALYLVTQAVPTAGLVPCVTAFPGGWSLGSVDVRNGQASFTLDSDRGGSGALRVTLRPGCDVTGAIEVPSDHPGTARFDEIPTVDTGFRGSRTYRFEGGCVTERFHVEAARAGALVDESSLAIGFVTRTEITSRMGYTS